MTHIAENQPENPPQTPGSVDGQSNTEFETDCVETNALVAYIKMYAHAREADTEDAPVEQAAAELVVLALPTLDVVLQQRRETPADGNPALVYLARMGTGSRRTMREALDVMAAALSGGRRDLLTFPWEDLRYGHTAALRALLVERYAPATVNKMLAALRGTLKEAWRLGLMSAEEHARASDVASVRATTLLRGRSLSAGELRVLIGVCVQDRTAAGARDGALVATLYGAGLRRSEAVTLKLADYDAESGALTIRAGKGRKDRIAYAPSGGRDAMAAWLEHRGSAAGALFQPVLKSGKIVARGMTDQAVLYILRKRQLEAALSPFTPHDLRRSFVSDLLDVGADIATVQKMAGHANVQTTARYDRRDERVKKKAADLLHVPFQKN